MYSTPLKSRVDYNSGPFSGLSRLVSGNNGNTRDSSGEKGDGVNTLDSQKDNNVQGVNSDSSLPLGASLLMPAGSLAPDLSAVDEHLRVTNLGGSKPLELASQYIDHLERRDANSPVLDERSYYNNGVNYNFSKEVGGLGAFTPFERQQVINIPDEILREASKSEIKSDMGIFPELGRCWITIDNKLILWNLKDSTDYQSIDEIKHTILKVALVKPKKDMFVDYVNHLLLIATPFDIYLLAVSHNEETRELSVFNAGLSVSVHGLDVSQITCYDKTGQIFFAGRTSGQNVWGLQYSGSDDWFNSKCNKVCLTQSAWSSLLPANLVSKLPGSGYIRSFFEEDSKYAQETVVQLKIDQSRGIVYTLSSKSNIRAYLINGNHLENPMSIEPAYIRRIMGTTTARGAAILGPKFLKISQIVPVSRQENHNLFLVAITVGGVRLNFNGSIGRSGIEALRLESIKFPPSSVTPEVIRQELQNQQLEQQKKGLRFYSNLNYSESVHLKFQKKSSVFLETTSASTIISPGIFFSAVRKSTSPQDSKQTTDSKVSQSNNQAVQHKLFVSVPDYGVLKNHGKYVENATLLDSTGNIKEIVLLTPTFNATQTPEGYANEFATQYSSENLKVAVLTNSAVEIYRYRTPDEVFEALVDNPLPFLINYGVPEACSTALFVTCKLNKSEMLRSAALTFFTVGIPGIVDIKPRYNKYMVSTVSSFFDKPSFDATPKKSLHTTPSGGAISMPDSKASFSLDDVTLSARFYGIALLITRLLRDIWSKQIFVTYRPERFNSKVKEGSSEGGTIAGMSVSKADVEYYLSSIAILNEFFNMYGNSLTVVYPSIISGSDISGKPIDKSEEVANQAENIAINSMMKLVQSIMEALSFLNVLYEESEVEGFEQQYVAFKDIIKSLSPEIQVDLTKLKFKDLFAPNEHTKVLVREILSSIINRNITRGASIEYTATALQERCGSFCSSSDILGFRAIEHLRKAKEIGLRDYETLKYHLNNAIKLFERIVDDLSFDKLKEAVSIMLELNYFPKTIGFLLNIANSVDKAKLAYQYVADGSLEHDGRKVYYDKRVLIYDLVFETLVMVDNLAARGPSNGTANIPVPNDISSLREESYSVALKYNDKLFHYKLYDWLASQKCEEKLLELDTEFILPNLQEQSKSSLELSNLLWVYLSRRSKYFEAAEILYSLANSDFELNLGERIEYLSRANGFCNGVCNPSHKQRMVELSTMIQEIFDVAAVQDDLLSLVTTDQRIESNTKQDLIKQLDGKVLPVSDLFNDFAVPLGYHEICLVIFKVSDFRNQEEIKAKWDELFESLKKELSDSQSLEDSINFINLLSNVVIKVGKQVHSSEFVFPISDLFSTICTLFYEALPHEHIERGSIASIFLSAGVSYGKLYYILKDLIETSDSPNALFTAEMTWLIKEWYKNDRKLRDIITYDEVSSLDQYSIQSDPIEQYTRRTGNCV
ncbi:hypothetical protein HG536_0B05760 [Torulaspora globosa]|uniref:Nucleoporin Nup133/Nup155-like N-terminal domain-containing protein n=1 Tax=Torulaspora globosa TaxID=48254 RepID=A0A7G3ZDX5_9SACH|nr:uncharacterized protein HG536_0B05760 [Torulaspora globosa]QLL31711.1 hypothetical protein HG536_0B05760 [Torulaspora globosa]